MARRQVGMIDGDLLDRVDREAGVLGQTRRVFVERALVAALEGRPLKQKASGEPLRGSGDLVGVNRTLAFRNRKS